MFINRPTTKTTTTATTTRILTSSNKKAACWGINDYPGTQNDLNGCVNDSLKWQELLNGIYGFNVERFNNSRCTKQAYVETLGNYIADSKAGDKLVFTYSGHGTSVIEKPGISNDEADGKDEAICLYDGNLIDDDIRAILNNLKPEVSFTFISDSCFSGSVTRAYLLATRDSFPPKIRYLPPSDSTVAASVLSLPMNKRIFYQENDMKEILISGCSDTEYSYDAMIGGKYSGAFTYFATKVISETPQITYNQFYAKLKTLLPNSQYPQSPQLEGSETNKNKILFS